MKKLNSLPLMLLSAFFLFSCAQISDKSDVKNTALNAAKEYCEQNAKNGTKYKIEGIDSCVVQGNEAFIKITVIVPAGKKEKKKIISAGCERDKEQNWKVTSISME